MSTTARSAGPSALSSRGLVDPRGLRFAATLTSAVLAVALVLAPSPAAVVLVAVQTLFFGIAAAAGVQQAPYSWLFKTFLRPRLGRPAELEDPAPPRFAQAVGLAFSAVALAGFLTGLDLLGVVATGFALAAAILNAAFGLCLGCELFLLGRRALH